MVKPEFLKKINYQAGKATQYARFQFQLIKISASFVKTYGIHSFINKVWEIKFKKRTTKYSAWINEVENKFISQLDIQATTKSFNLRPKISVLVPLYNVNPAFFKKCLESVINQTYPNWELCVYDDGSIINKKENQNLLEEFSQSEQIKQKIKYKFSSQNKHISHALNQCLDMATGEYFIVLDDDDVLNTNALLLLVCQINRFDNAQIIYSDEDKVDENDNRCKPLFKPDWSNETILNGMYTTHVAAIKTQTARQIGGYRLGYEGSQDYDLILRLSEIIKPKDIYHIPFILYHWRIHDQSTAEDIYRKPYVEKATQMALSDTIKRRNLSANIEKGEIANTFRLKFDIKGNPHISIIIPTYNQWKVLKRCIDSITTKTDYKNYDVVIVNNRSDGKNDITYLDSLKNKHTVIDYDKPFNFSAINNFAFDFIQRKFKSDHIVLLNNDTEIINSQWLSAMLEYSQLDEIGAVGAQLLYPDNSIQHAGVILGIQGVAGHSHKHFKISEPGHMGRIKKIQNISAVTAACLMVKSNLYKQMNGLDEVNLKIAFNDVDFCLKLQQAGFRNIYTPYAKLYHYESLSRGLEDDPTKIDRFKSEIDYMRTKWGNLLMHDPYYNINLSLEHENFEFRPYTPEYLNELFNHLKALPLHTV